MADSQLTTIGASSTSWGATLPYIGPYDIGGAIYVMVCRGPGANPFTVHVNKSTNNGASWSDISTLAAADLGLVSILGGTFAKEVYLNRIYGLFLGRVGGAAADNRLRVAYYDTLAGTWTTLPSQPVLTVPKSPSGADLSPLGGLDITLNDTNGNLTIIYGWGYEILTCDPISLKTASYRRGQYSDYISGVWGAQLDIPGQPSQLRSINPYQIVRSPSGRLHIFLYDLGFNTDCSTQFLINSGVYEITRSAGGAWNTFQTLTLVAPDAPPYQGIYNTFPIGLGIVSGGQVIVPYMAGSSNPGVGAGPGISGMSLNAFRATDSDNPAWSVDVIDATISSGSDLNVPGTGTGGGQANEAEQSLTDKSGSVIVYYLVSTSHVSPINTRSLSGDIRKSVFSGGVWQPFSLYRTFADGIRIPTGVYAYGARALYLRVNSSAVSDQSTMFHFLGESELALSCPVNNTGSVGNVFSSFLVAANGTLPYTYSIVSGALPPGLSLNSSTGEISGVPTAPGTFTYTARVTDSLASTADATCEIDITAVQGQGGRGFIRFSLNVFDSCLGREYRLYNRIDRQLLACGIKPTCFLIDEREWGVSNDDDEMPPGAPAGSIAFNPSGQISLPTAVSGDNVIFQFTVPVGYDGIILGQFHGYYRTPIGPIIPPQFIEGSGDIVWRISANDRFLRDCGSMLVSLGSIRAQAPVAGGLQLRSQDLVRYIVAAPNLSGTLAAGQGAIVAGCHGYFWPRK